MNSTQQIFKNIMTLKFNSMLKVLLTTIFTTQASLIDYLHAILALFAAGSIDS